MKKADCTTTGGFTNKSQALSDKHMKGVKAPNFLPFQKSPTNSHASGSNCSQNSGKSGGSNNSRGTSKPVKRINGSKYRYDYHTYEFGNNDKLKEYHDIIKKGIGQLASGQELLSYKSLFQDSSSDCIFF